MSLIVYGAEDIASYTALVNALQFSCSTAYLFFSLTAYKWSYIRKIYGLCEYGWKVWRWFGDSCSACSYIALVLKFKIQILKLW